MQYQIEIREIEPVRDAYMKYKGIATEANKDISQCFQINSRKSEWSAIFQLFSHEPGNKTGRNGIVRTHRGKSCRKRH